MPLSKSLTKKSKYLALVLRHRPEAIGLELALGGWVPVEDLLARQTADISADDLDAIVAEEGKRRYQYDESRRYVRAVQGHSAPVDMLYEPTAPPETLFHGTHSGALAAILEEGLKPMSRQYVHCSPDPETARTVGARRGDPVILRVAAQRHAEAGGVWFVADNGVWLTASVEPEFLSR